MESNPKELEPYDIAHKMKLKEQDNLEHIWWGNYGISAMMVALDRCLNGQKATLEYIKDSVLRDTQENGELTEEEKQRELNRFLAQNNEMRARWKSKHKGR